MITWERTGYAVGAGEPVTVDAVMAYGRITDERDRTLIEALIKAAREETERLTGRILYAGTFAIVSDTGAVLSRAQFPIAPVTAITGAAWINVPEAPSVPLPLLPLFRMAGGEAWIGDWPDPTIVPLIAWPTVRRTPPGPPRRRGDPREEVDTAGLPIALQVTAEAGYAAPENVPEGMRQHVLTLALLRYQHRDDPEGLERVAAFAASGVSSFGVIQV